MGVAILWLAGYLVPLGLLLLAIWGVTRWMRAGSADPLDYQ
jgi:hypothetical protein